MSVWILRLDLPESRYLIHDEFLAPEDSKNTLALHFLLERNLRAGKKTHGYMRFSDGGETTSERVIELRRYQLVSYLRRSGCDKMQTVVTH
jgi:hypothetical protein